MSVDKLEILFTCQDCLKPIKAEVEASNITKLYIEPCENCLQSSYDEGLEHGKESKVESI